MTINERRFKVIGTIGNGSELRPIPRVEPVCSYHLMERQPFAQSGFPDWKEIAIRYSLHDAMSAMRDLSDDIEVRPILRQFAPSVSN